MAGDKMPSVVAVSFPGDALAAALTFTALARKDGKFYHPRLLREKLMAHRSAALPLGIEEFLLLWTEARRAIPQTEGFSPRLIERGEDQDTFSWHGGRLHLNLCENVVVVVGDDEKCLVYLVSLEKLDRNGLLEEERPPTPKPTAQLSLNF